MDTLRATVKLWRPRSGLADLPGRVPGTEIASGVAVAPAVMPSTTRLAGTPGSSAASLAGADVQIAHDFGAAGVARDVHVAGNRITAVVGGRVRLVPDPVLGPVQWDSGGVIHVVDLASGWTWHSTPGPALPPARALSPGDRVVAEGYPLIITLVAPPLRPLRRSRHHRGPAGDLYLFAAP